MIKPRAARWLCLFGLALGVLTLRVALADEAPLPLADYWQKLDSTRALAESLREVPPDQSGPALRAEADSWDTITTLALPDGSTQPIDHNWLTTALRAEPPNPEQVQALIDTALAARADWGQTPRTANDLAALQTILARPEFQWETPEPSWLQKTLQQFWEWLWSWLNRLFGGRQTALGDPRIAFALAALLVLVLAVVIGFFVRGLLANMVAETTAPTDPHAADEDLTAEAALQKAQALSTTGDYRAAVRYLYLSALLLLDERGLLRYNRTLTNREYLRHLTHHPELLNTLGEVVEVFDRVWYGYQPLDEAEYQLYAERVTELQKEK